MTEIIGRNDPCPCGSGKKYKKCCAQKDDVERRAAQERPNVDDVLPPETSIYKVWLRWRNARKVSDFNFLFDMIQTASPLQTRLGDRPAFISACDDGTAAVPSGDAEFRHLRIIDGARARLLQTLGTDDVAVPRVRCECIELSKTESGWRITDFTARDVAKADQPKLDLGMFDPDPDATLKLPAPMAVVKEAVNRRDAEQEGD